MMKSCTGQKEEILAAVVLTDLRGYTVFNDSLKLENIVKPDK